MQFKRTVKFVFAVLLIAVFAQQSNAQLANGKSKFLGNITGSSVPSNWSNYWNQVTPENGTKWGSIQGGGQNSWNWTDADVAYNYAQSHGYKFKYHNFVWGAQQPSWVNSSNVKSALQTLMNNVKARYTNIWAIDVVNEPLPGHNPPSYASGLGGSGSTGWDWVITAFQMARSTFPSSVKLLINEYGTENDANARNTYKTIINLLKSRGLIDGIGLQAHYFNLDNMSASQMTTCLNDYGTLGIPIYISELDITGGGSDAGQSSKYQELFPVMWNHSSVQGITLWGYIVGSTWATGTGLVNSNGTERPAMTWLKSFMGGGGGSTLSVSTTSLSVAAAANSTGTFNITSNVSWTVSDNQSWLTVNPASGSNNGTVTVTAQQNTSTASRSATVTISGTGVSSKTVTVTQSGTGASSTVSINVGGSATGSFSADQYFSGGTTYTNTATIDMSQITSNQPPAAIFNSERYGSFSYTIPNRTAGSTQTVTLYFAETYLSGSGQRTFNVSINGSTVLSNFDIYASAGGQNKAIARSFSTTANSSRQVVIQFSSVVQNPKVNGIAVAGSIAKLAEQEQSQQVIPAGYALAQNYPNPFNPTTVIAFGIPENSFVSLIVYNSLGIKISELAGRDYSAGQHTVRFDATNLSSGVYFYTIRAGRYTTTQKMILQK